MISLELPRRGTPFRLLCLGAHSDDIEIGCGATVLGLSRARADLEVTWVVFSAAGERAKEAERGAERFLEKVDRPEVELHAFRDGFFPHEGAAIKEVFEDLKTHCYSDLVLTHRGKDCHQDHRAVAELSWNTFRDHLILEYEIPKYDGDLGSPNVFFPVTEELRREKVALLMELFGTQRSKRWFSPETFDGLMRLRGVESASPTGYAEAFDGRKLVLGG